MLPIDFAALPRLTKEEFYTIEKPKYKAGVYIQHIDGSLYLEEEWVSNGFSNDDANGVYVSNGKQAFIVAKDSLGEMPWSSKPTTLIDGVTQLGDTYVWTSTQYDATQAWIARLGGLYDYYRADKNNNYLVRPVCTYIKNNLNA